MDMAIVTGATGGIGRALCRRLSEDGLGIIALYGSNHHQATELRREITARGGTCIAHAVDLSSDSGVDKASKFLDEYLEQVPSHNVRALVNNAAKLLSPSFLETQPSDFDAYFAINAKAPFFLSQRILKRMKSGGSIVNVSSASAHFSSPGDIAYAMSKAAVESLTRNMAEAVAPMGIRVNAVIPGFTNNGHPAFDSPKALEYMSSFAVLGGVALPDTVAAAVSFLVSAESARTTGSLLDVTGGSLLGARGHRAGSIQDIL